APHARAAAVVESALLRSARPGAGQRPYVLDGARKGNGDHGTVGAQAFRFVRHPRRRFLHRPARLRAFWQRGAVPGSARSQDARRARLAARFAPQGRPEEEPAVPVELDIEIWPTCIVIPEGYRLSLNIRGRDYEHDDAAATLSNMKNPM